MLFELEVLEESGLEGRRETGFVPDMGLLAGFLMLGRRASLWELTLGSSVSFFCFDRERDREAPRKLYSLVSNFVLSLDGRSSSV